MRVLCTGGAGYVGGHCHRAFLAQGCESWVFDDLSEGNREAASPDRLVIGDIRDTEAVARALRELGRDDEAAALEQQIRDRAAAAAPGKE